MKNVLVALTMAAALFGAYLPARAIEHRPAVNLRNGVIYVRNNSSFTIQVALAHQWSRGSTMENATIAPGHLWHSTVCCFAAGSPYVLHAVIRANGEETRPYIDFNPALCMARPSENGNGDRPFYQGDTVGFNNFPYGFASILINPSHDKVALFLSGGCPTRLFDM